MDLRRIEAQRQRSGVRAQGSRQPGGDARAAVRCKMAVDQRIGSERLDEIDFGDQHGFSRRARLEVLRADAEQHLAPLPLPRDQVHRRRADEPGDESGGRPRVHLERRADLLDAAGVHHDHAMRQRHRLDLVVSDVKAGGSEAPVEGLQLGAHLHPEFGIEIGQRFIEQEHRRLAHDGAPHGDALALAARKLARPSLQKGLQLEDPGGAPHPRVDVRLRQAAEAQPIGHVLVNRHVRIERVVLEHHGDIAVLRLEIVDDTRTDRDPAGADALEPGDHAQQRRFAAARGPDDDHELAVGHFGGDAVDHLGVAVALAHVAKRHAGHYFSVSTRPFTNQRCIRTTTAAGGNSASIAVAITRFHSVSASPPVIMRLMPITAVYIDS